MILEPLIVIGNADGTAAGLRGKIPLGDAHSDDEDDDESKSQRKSLCQKSGWQRKAVGIKPPTVLVFLVGLSLEKEDNIRLFFVHVEDCLKV